MKLFELRRTEDEGGVSGCGTVAQGVIFDSGKCVVSWLTEHTSVAVYDSIADVVAIHGHGGKTEVVQIADVDMDAVGKLCCNRYQDHCEGVGVEFQDGNTAYVWRQREQFSALFREVTL